VLIEVERSGRQNISKTTENVESIPELIHEDHPRIITVVISYGVWQENLTESLNMRLISASFDTFSEFLTNNNMVVVPHPLCSPDLIP
jgi:hypothetical protein